MTTYLRIANTIATVLILAACATNTAGLKPKSEASATATHNSACPDQTGSRIAGNSADCAAFGRSYSREDIDRTGATTADEALRLMDTSITVHR